MQEYLEWMLNNLNSGATTMIPFAMLLIALFVFSILKKFIASAIAIAVMLVIIFALESHNISQWINF